MAELQGLRVANGMSQAGVIASIACVRPSVPMSATGTFSPYSSTVKRVRERVQSRRFLNATKKGKIDPERKCIHTREAIQQYLVEPASIQWSLSREICDRLFRIAIVGAFKPFRKPVEDRFYCIPSLTHLSDVGQDWSQVRCRLQCERISTLPDGKV